MKILAIDSSAVSCSVAVSEDKQILAAQFVNNGLTHSQTMMPMVDAVLKKAGLSAADIDLFAVTNGPGSFTGVRIGVAAVKGLAFAHGTPCIGLSTLEVIAANVSKCDAIAIACMDARRNQVYTATFESGSLKRLSADEACAIKDMTERINSYNQPVYLAGDGAKLAYEVLKEQCPRVHLVDESELYQDARRACALAYEYKDKAYESALLVPRYLRLSQAERELKKRKDKSI